MHRPNRERALRKQIIYVAFFRWCNCDWCIASSARTTISEEHRMGGGSFLISRRTHNTHAYTLNQNQLHLCVCDKTKTNGQAFTKQRGEELVFAALRRHILYSRLAAFVLLLFVWHGLCYRTTDASPPRVTLCFECVRVIRTFPRFCFIPFVFLIRRIPTFPSQV